MYKIVSRLLIYGDMPKDTILMELADIVRKMDDKSQTKEELSTRVFTQMKHLLQVATDYGFDRNLWHNYLTFLLITNENPFSITCEKVGANEGSVNYFAKGDFRAFLDLFHYDFSALEEYLGIRSVSPDLPIIRLLEKRTDCIIKCQPEGQASEPEAGRKHRMKTNSLIV